MFSGKCNGKQSSPSGKSAIINPKFKQDFAFKLGGNMGSYWKAQLEILLFGKKACLVYGIHLQHLLKSSTGIKMPYQGPPALSV